MICFGKFCARTKWMVPYEILEGEIVISNNKSKKNQKNATLLFY